MQSEFDRKAAALLRSAPTPEIRRDYEGGLDALRRRRINTFDKLAERLPKLTGSAAWTGLRLAILFGRAKAVPVLLPLLGRGSSWALAELGGARARIGCIRVLQSRQATPIRLEAAYALTFMHDEEAALVLMDIVRDQHEDARLRGQAAEGLSEIFELNTKHKLYRRAAKTALDGLDDASPIVRFWCAFALGKMKYRPAIPTLRRLARRDKVVCPGWWKVSEEARDAIALIEGRPTPDRVPGQG